MTAAQRRYQKRIAAERKAAGLTVRGTVPKLKRWPECRGLSAKDQKLLRQRVTRESFKKSGLRINGKPRKNYLWPELGELSGYDRQCERQKLWLRNQRSKKSALRARRAVAALLSGNSLAAKLKAA